MHFKNSLSIISTNLTLVYRLLTFFCVMIVLAAAILVSILSPLTDAIQAANEGFDFFREMAQEGIFSTLNELFLKIGTIFDGNESMVETGLWLLCACFIFLKFLLCVAMVPASKILYDKMRTGYASSFFGSLITMALPTLGFATFSGIILGAVDIALFLLCWYLLKWLFSFFSIVSLGISLFLYVLVISARFSLFSQVLPNLLFGEKNILKAIKVGFFESLKTFKYHYPMTVTVYIAVISVLLAGGLTTFGILPLVFCPFALALYCAMNLTCGFGYHKQKYYIDCGKTTYEP